MSAGGLTVAGQVGPAEVPARVESVQTGAVADLPYRDRTMRSAFVKTGREGWVTVGALRFDADEHGDPAHHGGPNKALCAFPVEHYAHYSRWLGRELRPAAFGENLTCRGWTETDVCIGDVVLIEGVRCQVSSPRNPCYRLGARHGEPELVLEMEGSGRTGWYLRVLEAGRVRAGSPMWLEQRLHPHLTVAEANRRMHRDRSDRAGMERLVACPELGASWRRAGTRRLQGRLEDPRRRRIGPALDWAADG